MGNAKSNPAAPGLDRKRTTKRTNVKVKPEDGVPAWPPTGAKSYIDMDIPEERGTVYMYL